MNINDIEVEIIMGENTSTIITEALLRLYRDNASEVLGKTEKKD